MEETVHEEKKKGILFKRMDLIFVYLFIFLVGIAVVLAMTSFLNNKVKEFNEDLAIAVSKK